MYVDMTNLLSSIDIKHGKPHANRHKSQILVPRNLLKETGPLFLVSILECGV